MISKKECIAMFATLALIEIHRKRLDLMKTAFPLAFKDKQNAMHAEAMMFKNCS